MQFSYTLSSFRALCTEGMRRGFDYSRKDDRVEASVKKLLANDRQYRSFLKRHRKSPRSFRELNYARSRHQNNRKRFIKERDKAKEVLFKETVDYLNEIMSGSQSLQTGVELWGVHRGRAVNGKETFKTNPDARFYLLQKQLENNIKKYFKIQQKSRQSIITALKQSLDHAVPLQIVKIDIRSFFEKLPHKNLIYSLEKRGRLDYVSKRLISGYIQSCINEFPGGKGVLRGIGLSSVLAEAYMIYFDNFVTGYEGVSFYSRYVDDCIIVLAEEVNLSDFIQKATKSLQDLDLEINYEKSLYIKSGNRGEFTRSSRTPPILNIESEESVNFLGYTFSRSVVKNKSKPKSKGKSELKVTMTSERLKRRTRKLKLAFRAWRRHKINAPLRSSHADRLLVQRVQFLAANTRLYKPNGPVTVGIYYSNQGLTPSNSSLEKLDLALKRFINENETLMSVNLVEKLKKISFQSGFEHKIFIRYSQRKLEKIGSCWKGIN